jgi:hypothetical protein
MPRTMVWDMMCLSVALELVLAVDLFLVILAIMLVSVAYWHGQTSGAIVTTHVARLSDFDFAHQQLSEK